MPVMALLSMVFDVQAQVTVDDSLAIVGSERAYEIVSRLGEHLRSSDARVANLRQGRDGAICGSVEVRNRMGVYTGPRGFVADLSTGFVGRLPEGPELRNPASAAGFKAMERAKALFAANCTD